MQFFRYTNFSVILYYMNMNTTSDNNPSTSSGIPLLPIG